MGGVVGGVDFGGLGVLVVGELGAAVVGAVVALTGLAGASVIPGGRLAATPLGDATGKLGLAPGVAGGATDVHAATSNTAPIQLE